MGVKQEDHDALLAEVQRLEVELGKIRQDLQGVVGCKGKCEQLTTLQETVNTTNMNLLCVILTQFALSVKIFLTSSFRSISMNLFQISEQVSSQVRKELQALFFGNTVSEGGRGEVPESLIYWLSQRYVSTPDLQAALASLELSILRNVSLQLELNRAQTLGEAESQTNTIVRTVTGSVQHAAAGEGMTEEVTHVST